MSRGSVCGERVRRTLVGTAGGGWQGRAAAAVVRPRSGHRRADRSTHLPSTAASRPSRRGRRRPTDGDGRPSSLPWWWRRRRGTAWRGSDARVDRPSTTQPGPRRRSATGVSDRGRRDPTPTSHHGYNDNKLAMSNETEPARPRLRPDPQSESPRPKWWSRDHLCMQHKAIVDFVPGAARWWVTINVRRIRGGIESVLSPVELR